MVKRLVLLICIIVIFLSGCSSNYAYETEKKDTASESISNVALDSNEQVLESNKEGMPAISIFSKSKISLGSGNSHGYYSLEPWGKYLNIMYTDYETYKQKVLCNNPKCTHDNSSCLGYEDFNSNTPSILALEDKVIFIYPGNPYSYDEDGDIVLARIDVVDIDGTNRKTICTFTQDIEIRTDVVAYDEDNLYILQRMYNQWQRLNNSKFCRINLTSGEQYLIKEFTDISDKEIFLLGTSENLFVFKRIIDGERNKTLEGMGPEDSIDTQVHEIFTVNVEGEISKGLFSYLQGKYSSYIIAGKVMLINHTEKEVYFLDLETFQPLITNNTFPISEELLAGEPIAAIGDWIIVDLVSKDVNDYRYAFNTKTGECVELTLSSFAYDFESLVEIKDTVGNQVLVCISTHLGSFVNPLPDGTEVNDSRYVEDWALINANDFLANIPNYIQVTQE